MHTVSSLKGIRKIVNRLQSQQIGKKQKHLLPTKKDSWNKFILIYQCFGCRFGSAWVQIWIRIQPVSLDPDPGSPDWSPKEGKNREISWRSEAIFKFSRRNNDVFDQEFYKFFNFCDGNPWSGSGSETLATKYVYLRFHDPTEYQSNNFILSCDTLLVTYELCGHGGILAHLADVR